MVRFSEVFRKEGKKGKDRGAALNRAEPEPERIRTRDFLDFSEPPPTPEEPLEEGSFEEADQAVQGSVEAIYGELLEKARVLRERIQANQGISPSPALAVLHRIIQMDRIDELFDYAVSRSREEDLPRHSIAVSVGALKVGKGLEYNTEELLKLGLAAFLENVGMYRIPREILTKQGALTTEELARIREHPLESARILRSMGTEFQWLADVAVQIHERSDGSGYPRGLRRDEISEPAAIIGLMDTYMAMIRKRPYRHEYVQTDAVKSIIQLGKGTFPQRVVKEFLNQVSLFPVGTFVKLNNDSIGRVVSTVRTRPLRPSVELLYDGLGNRQDRGKVVNLSDSPLLHIVNTIDERDLP